MRRLIKINEEIANSCYAGKDSLETILAETEKDIFGLLQSRTSGDFVPIRQVALNVLDKIEQATRSKSTVTGIPTGFIDLDYRLSGLQPSDLILIAARPSMGKTAFVLNIADYIGVRKQKTTLIFSLEMSKEQLVNRMLAMESNVDSQKLRTGTLTDADWDAVVEGIGTIGNSKLIIDDTADSEEVLSWASRLFFKQNDTHTADAHTIMQLTEAYLMTLKTDAKVETELVPVMNDYNKIDYAVVVETYGHGKTFTMHTEIEFTDR
jgi:replicative DNA helicase